MKIAENYKAITNYGRWLMPESISMFLVTFCYSAN